MAPSDSSLTVYIEHRAELLSYANRFVQDPARAEDVVQEAWLRLSARVGKGEEITNALSYLYSITRNLAIDWARRATREVLEAPDSPTWRGLAAQIPSAEHVQGLAVGGRVVYTGSTYLDPANLQPVPAWTRFDMSVAYTFERPDGKPLALRGQVINIGNNNYWMSAGGYLSQGQPRTFMLSLTADF